MIDVNILLDLLAAIGGLGGLALVIGVAYWLGNKFTEVNYRFKILERRIERLVSAFTSYQEFFVEFLTREGVIKPIDKELLIRES